jgi:hypothetical protein
MGIYDNISLNSSQNEKCFRQNTHLTVSNFFLLNRAVYKITWKNIVELDRPQMIIRCMRIACWTTKATDTHSEHATRTALQGNNIYMKAPQSCIIRSLLVLFIKQL